MHHVPIERSFDSWRRAARALLVASAPPAEVLWTDDAGDEPVLSGLAPRPDCNAGSADAPPVPALAVPGAFLNVAARVACHRDPDRWNLLYRVLWRLTRGGERHLLDVAVDDDVFRLSRMDRAVARDRHKMTAFVRFRRVDRGGRPWFVAWHRPDHYTLRLAAPFFARRFAVMQWAILTPDESATWDGATTEFGPGVPAADAPAPDALEALWRTYYASTFNPARVRVRAMKKELPVRHWPTLPEAQLIPDLVRDAARRVEAMMATGKTPATTTSTRNAAGRAAGPGDAGGVPGRPDASEPAGGEQATCRPATSAAEFLPPRLELPVLREAARGCRGCGLYCDATQTVFGEGPADALVMFVGEQPGDQEDHAGRPFVGPSGQLLDDALHQAGVPRDECYVTNTVKHFKFEPRGTRRIHAKPSAREVTACRPWLEAEIKAVRPKMIVCLGATAAQALLGRDFRVTRHRGEVLKTEWAPWVLATVHPSSLLRIPDDATREEAYGQFVEDMRAVSRQIDAERRKAGGAAG